MHFMPVIPVLLGTVLAKMTHVAADVIMLHVKKYATLQACSLHYR